jgi:hypothetical protein
MNLKGGKDVSCEEIGAMLALTKNAMYAWMFRRLSKPECPWKQGSAKMKFSLKTG